MTVLVPSAVKRIFGGFGRSRYLVSSQASGSGSGVGAGKWIYEYKQEVNEDNSVAVFLVAEICAGVVNASSLC